MIEPVLEPVVEALVEAPNLLHIDRARRQNHEIGTQEGRRAGLRKKKS